MGSISLDGINMSQYSTMVNSETAKADGVKFSGLTQSGNSVSMNVTVGNTTAVYTVTLPDIDGPEGSEEDNAEALRKFAANLEAFVDDLKAANGSSTVQVLDFSTFTDIYAVMDLLLKVAQQQYQTAGEMRAAQHKSQQALLESQASSIRSEAESAYNKALFSAITSACGCLAQGVMMGIGTYKQVSAATNSNVATTKAEVNQASTDLKAAKATATPGAAAYTNEQLQALGLDPNTQPTPQQVETALQNQGVISTDTQAKGEAYTHARNTVDNQKAALSATSDTNAKENTQLKAAKNEAKTATKAFDDYKKAHPTDTGSEDYKKLESHKLAADNKVTQYQEDITLSNKSIETQSKQVQNSRIDAADKAQSYNQSMDQDLAAMDQKINDAKAANPNDPKIATLEKQRDALATFKGNQQTDMKQSLVEGATAKYDMAVDKYQEATQQLTSGVEWKKGEAWSAFGNVTKGLFDSGAAMLKAKSEEIQSKSQATSKEYDAQMESLQAEGENIKELRDSAHDMITNVRQTLLAILDAESQATRAAINI